MGRTEKVNKSWKNVKKCAEKPYPLLRMNGTAKMVNMLSNQLSVDQHCYSNNWPFLYNSYNWLMTDNKEKIKEKMKKDE